MKILLYILAGMLLCSCNPCECKLDKWKNDSKAMLPIFKEAFVEIKKYDNFFKREKYDNSFGKDKLFFNADDLRKFEKKYNLNLVKLNQLFINTNNNSQTNSYISFDGEHLALNYLDCQWNFWTYEYNYSGCLYYSPNGIRPSFTRNLKSIVVLKDSLSFGDNWYYLMTRCEGCGR